MYGKGSSTAHSNQDNSTNMYAKPRYLKSKFTASHAGGPVVGGKATTKPIKGIIYTGKEKPDEVMQQLEANR